MNFKTKNQAMGVGIAIGAALGAALMGLTHFGEDGLAIGMGLSVTLGAYLGRSLPNK